MIVANKQTKKKWKWENEKNEKKKKVEKWGGGLGFVCWIINFEGIVNWGAKRQLRIRVWDYK